MGVYASVSNKISLTHETGNYPKTCLRDMGIYDYRSDSILQCQVNHEIASSQRMVMQRHAFAAALGYNKNPVMAPNRTGLPDDLKNGLESLSGISLSDVKVHYNSSRPATVGAQAYAQGNQIHLAPGHEHHLPHEGWHVIQQKQGRVQPTIEAYGQKINDDKSLEKEADHMGKRAMHLGDLSGNSATDLTVHEGRYENMTTIQRNVGFEFETDWMVKKEKGKTTTLGKIVHGANYQSLKDLKKGEAFYRDAAAGFEIQADETPQGTDIEFVTDHVDESVPANITNLMAAVTAAANAIDLAGAGVGPAGYDATPVLATLGGNVLKNVRIYPGTQPMNGRPQATVGVRLKKFNKIIEAIRTDAYANPQGAAFTELMGLGDGNIISITHNRIQAVAGNVIPGLGAPPSNKLKSLMGLIIPILLKGNVPYLPNGGPLSYSKLIAPIMARTDFGTIYNMLPNAERIYFSNHPDEFSDYILSTAQLANTEGTEIFNHGFDDDNDTVRIPSLTRGYWLENMTQGVDKLRKSRWTRRKLESAFGSLGNRVDHNVSGTAYDGMILELRRIQPNLPIASWQPLAVRIGAFINNVNNAGVGPVNY